MSLSSFTIIYIIDKIYILKHGIKPKETEILNINDDTNMLIYKFLNWYFRAFDFAKWDPRDLVPFRNINKSFIIYYDSIIKDHEYKYEIKNNYFIIKMLECIKLENPYNIILSDIIINIINIKLINSDDCSKHITFDILNINGDTILTNLIFNFPLDIVLVHDTIFEKIKLANKINFKSQLQIIYENELINSSINDIIINI